jgi:DNA-binding beta-propeller fold protein YncE
MRALTALLILGTLLAGCSSREHQNPFDPANPQTGGRPADLRALAGDGQITLLWTPAHAPDLVGFQVFRKVQGQTTYQPLSGVLPSTSGSYVDGSLPNGTTQSYRVFFVFTNGLGNLPAEDSATPGPIRPWVTEFDGGSVTRLTPDGRYVAEREGGLVSPNGVAIDRNTGLIWVSDSFGGKVQVINPGAGTFLNIAGLGQPTDLTIDLTDQTAWICDPAAGSIRHFTRFGTSATPSEIPLLDSPNGVAMEQGNRLLWVCERGGSRVRTFLSNGNPQWSLPVPAPSRVAVDSVTHEGWVTSFLASKVYRIGASGALLDSVTSVSGPIGVQVDARRGRIWICDALGDALVAVRRDATVEFRVTGLPEVGEVDVDLRTGNAWASVPATGTVARISPGGQVLGQVTGLVGPASIAIDPGP